MRFSNTLLIPVTTDMRLKSNGSTVAPHEVGSSGPYQLQSRIQWPLFSAKPLVE